MHKLAALPKWALFLLITAIYVALMLGKSLLTGEELEPARIVVTVVLGFVVTAAFFWIVRWQRAREGRKPDGYPTVTNFRSAVSSGRLPRGAKAEEWIPELLKVIRQERPMIWLGPLVFGAFTALGVVLILEHPDYPWFWVLCTIVFAGIAVWYGTALPRRRRTMEALISQLETSATEERESPHF